MARKCKIWEERIANGLCKYCGKNPPDRSKLCTRPNSPPSNVCVQCKKIRYEKYKDRYYMSKEKHVKYRRIIKKQILEKYGGKCTCCGENRWEFLTIDHKNSDGNIERTKRLGDNKSGSSTYGFYLELKREPIREDLQILCFNCNNSFAHYGYSPACPECKRKVNPHFKTKP